MNTLISSQIKRIDSNMGDLMALSEGYMLRNEQQPMNAEEKEVFASMYKKYESRIEFGMELVWFLMKAEKEGVE